MSLPDPNTREEIYLRNIGDGEGTVPDPVTRKERYLYKIATGDGDIPDNPHTREEIYLEAIAEGGGGGGSLEGGYTVTFVSGSDPYAIKAVKDGESIDEVFIPIKDCPAGKIFGYWNTAADGSGTEIYFPYTPQSDISLYAQFIDPYLWLVSDTSFTLGVTNVTKNWNGTLETCTDGTTWSSWNGSTTVTAGVINGKYRIGLRGTGNTKFSTGSAPYTDYTFTISGINVTFEGYLASLFDYQTVASGNNLPSLTQYACNYLFNGNTSIVNTPRFEYISTSIGIYMGMFSNCTNLKKAHNLPAPTLYNYSYNNMFYNDTSLIRAPEISARHGAQYALMSMFEGCSALVQAPAINLQSGSTGCLRNMFNGCLNLEEIPALSILTMSTNECDQMFAGCAKIKISTTQSDVYANPYKIPFISSNYTGTTSTGSLSSMFANTGGTLVGTPTVNTVYYTANKVIKPTMIGG